MAATSLYPTRYLSYTPARTRLSGHWWVDGRKPYMVYSETGGTSYAAENMGWTDDLASGKRVVW